jgi:two-component system response regulator WspF
LRIAIVNDVAIAAEALRRVLLSVPGYQLAWLARDGAEAVEKCRQDTPDLILMDLMMPVMDGAETTRQIMAQTPCAILVVTATVEGHSAKVFEALGAGALDAVQTPVLAGKGQLRGASALKFKIDSIRALVFGENGRQSTSSVAKDEHARGSASHHVLVAIGASAGGPAALAKILERLPHDFPGAIVIIQHIDAQFVPSLAEWLNKYSKVSVRVARQGDRPQANTALIAGTNDHLIFVDSQTLCYTPEPRDRYYHPSIDVFFESTVRHWKGAAAGVLLTGMGKDGAEGLKSLRNAGYLTIAQDSASCAVYGMPKAAAELAAAAQILPLDEIPDGLIDFVSLSNR